MTGQLAFDVAPARVYECCGQPCASLRERPSKARPFPHAEDCSNPNVGQWVDRATGCMIRRLHCIGADGTCPHGGHPPDDPHLVDPYAGRCCLEIRDSGVQGDEQAVTACAEAER